MTWKQPENIRKDGADIIKTVMNETRGENRTCETIFFFLGPTRTFGSAADTHDPTVTTTTNPISRERTSIAPPWATQALANYGWMSQGGAMEVRLARNGVVVGRDGWVVSVSRAKVRGRPQKKDGSQVRFSPRVSFITGVIMVSHILSELSGCFHVIGLPPDIARLGIIYPTSRPMSYGEWGDRFPTWGSLPPRMTSCSHCSSGSWVGRAFLSN